MPPLRLDLHGENGGVYQRFQYRNGAIYYSARSGSWPVLGVIRSVWAANGAEHGRLGYPTSVEFALMGGISQTFQYGSVDYSAKRGASVNVWG